MASVTRVKICGITSVADAEFAASCGADAIGLVFYGPSPRNMESLAVAREVALAVGPFVSVVGLFVNPEMDFVRRVLAAVPLGLLQFHGDEKRGFCAGFERPYIKALRMKTGVDVASRMAEYPDSQGILLDAYRAGVPGGTGEAFDWSRVPSDACKPIVLAGGLSPTNAASAVAQVRPWAVDVSGGVEAAPGIKDSAKVAQFIASAKGL